MMIVEFNKQILMYNEIASGIEKYITTKFQNRSFGRIDVHAYTVAFIGSGIPKYKNFIVFRFLLNSLNSLKDVSKKEMLETIEKEFKLKSFSSIFNMVIDYSYNDFTYYLPEDKFDALYTLIKLKGR